jgi:hypothetical protein
MDAGRFKFGSTKNDAFEYGKNPNSQGVTSTNSSASRAFRKSKLMRIQADMNQASAAIASPNNSH